MHLYCYQVLVFVMYSIRQNDDFPVIIYYLHVQAHYDPSVCAVLHSSRRSCIRAIYRFAIKIATENFKWTG